MAQVDIDFQRQVAAATSGSAIRCAVCIFISIHIERKLIAPRVWGQHTDLQDGEQEGGEQVEQSDRAKPVSVVQCRAILPKHLVGKDGMLRYCHWGKTKQNIRIQH